MFYDCYDCFTILTFSLETQNPSSHVKWHETCLVYAFIAFSGLAITSSKILSDVKWHERCLVYAFMAGPKRCVVYAFIAFIALAKRRAPGQLSQRSLWRLQQP